MDERHIEKTLKHFARKSQAREDFLLFIDDDGTVVADEVVGMKVRIFFQLEINEAQAAARTDAKFMACGLPCFDGLDI